MTARDQDSAVDEELCSGCVEATRGRGRRFLADDFGSATASLARSADFDAARDRLRAGVAWESLTTSTGVGAAVGGNISDVACALGFRPNPSALAIVERRSE